MKVCLYSWTFLPTLGGQELVVDALARHLTKLGCPACVVCPPSGTPQQMKSHDAAAPYPVFRHGRFWSTRFGLSWHARAISKARKHFGFDLLHAHDVHPGGVMGLIASGAWKRGSSYSQNLRQSADATSQGGYPLVITSHGGDVKEGNARIIKPGMENIYRKTLQLADALISISSFTDTGYLRLGASPAKLIRIPNGVNLQQDAPPATRPPTLPPHILAGNYVLYLGRLKDRKGVDVLLRALAQTKPSAVTNAPHLVIAGSGPEEAKLKSLATELGLLHPSSPSQGRVLFVGPVEGLAKQWLLQNARAVCMPSTVWEAFPLVPLEAFAASVPVIATSVPGLGELITRPECGWVLPPSDVPALSAVLSQVLHHPPHPADVAARKSVLNDIAQTYAWEKIAANHISLYERLLSAK